MEIVRIIITGLIICFSSWIVGSIGVYWRTRIYKKSLSELRPPFLIFWIGLTEFSMCVIAVILIFLLNFNETNLVIAIGFFLFSFLGFWLILYALNWKIVIKEESFIFRNMFGKKRKIMYSEITGLKRLKIGGGIEYIQAKNRLRLIILSKVPIIYGIN